MTTFAIGDIHGCFDALVRLTEFAGITDADLAVWLGDYVDRGPDSAKVIEYLISLPSDQNRFLCGNHDLMMKNAIVDVESVALWTGSGGQTTLDSYSKEFQNVDPIRSIPKSHWTFLDGLESYFETESYIFVHASVDSELPMAEQTGEDLYWGSYHSIKPHFTGKHVICGHTSRKIGIPRYKPHASCIDTWVHGGGWLTCLDVESGHYYQANQQGSTQTGWLGNLNPNTG